MSPAVPILAYPGVSGFEAVGALAAFHAAGLEAELVSREALVETQEGARLVPHRLGYATLAAAPALVVPGGRVEPILADAELVRLLRERRGQFLLASGEAARVAAAAGLVEGRRVARLPGEAPLPGAEAVASRLVSDGRLLTCFPGDPLVDLVLHHVGHEHGALRAERAAHRLGREFRPFALGAAAP